MIKNYKCLKTKFKSEIKTGNKNIDEVKLIYKPVIDSKFVMIVLHGLTTRKEDFLPYGDYLNSLGVSSFHIDLPYHGERSFNDNNHSDFDINPERIKLFMNHILIDIKKSVSLLEKIGYKNIGILGYSLGGISALLAMGKDNRLNKCISICSGGDIADLVLNSPMVQDISEELIIKGYDYQDLKKLLADVEPCNYARNINPNNILMINGIFDNIVPIRNVRSFLSNLNGHPHIIWQPYDHFSIEPIKPIKEYLGGLN
ncbi:MAG: alpha/beta fold hydrolase [Nanoarchaeota archaeon]|nr:alpha/beta fold hydrolase [Nanoarchaeota archaeon]